MWITRTHTHIKEYDTTARSQGIEEGGSGKNQKYNNPRRGFSGSKNPPAIPSLWPRSTMASFNIPLG